MVNPVGGALSALRQISEGANKIRPKLEGLVLGIDPELDMDRKRPDCLSLLKVVPQQKQGRGKKLY